MLTVLSQRTLKYGLKGLLGLSHKLGVSSSPSHYYFAYGANLNPERFQRFNIRAEWIGTASLANHELVFDLPCEYLGKGFAGVSPCSNKTVWGSLFKINFEGLCLLDVLEWVPYRFYERRAVSITCRDQAYNASTYFTLHPQKNLLPSKGYLDWIIQGAKNAQLPAEYISQLQSHPFGENFPLDPGFRLSHPGKRRWQESKLQKIYLKHDELREKLTRIIP